MSDDGPGPPPNCPPRGEGGRSDKSDETEWAPLLPGGACGWCCGWCCCCCCCEASSPPPSLDAANPAGPGCMGDASRCSPKLSPRPRARYDPRSLRWRECPLLRPGGGFDSPTLWENGGDRYRCDELGGGAGCWGPTAFRFRGDSPVVPKSQLAHEILKIAVWSWTNLRAYLAVQYHPVRRRLPSCCPLRRPLLDSSAVASGGSRETTMIASPAAVAAAVGVVGRRPSGTWQWTRGLPGSRARSCSDWAD